MRICMCALVCISVCLRVHPYRVPLQARHGRRGTGGGEAGGTWPEWATCCISAGNERLDNILQEAPGCACLPSRGATTERWVFSADGGTALKINPDCIENSVAANTRTFPHARPLCCSARRAFFFFSFLLQAPHSLKIIGMKYEKRKKKIVKLKF